MRTRAAVAMEAGKPLEVMEVNLEGINLDCNPYPNVKLNSGSAKVYCHADISELINTGAYKTPLTIIFDYGYKNSISTSLEVRKGIDEP